MSWDTPALWGDRIGPLNGLPSFWGPCALPSRTWGAGIPLGCARGSKGCARCQVTELRGALRIASSWKIEVGAGGSGWYLLRARFLLLLVWLFWYETNGCLDGSL